MKLLSGLAPLRLINVQPDDIEKALKGIKGDPKRGATMARTRQIAYMFLHGVFRKAVKKRVITFNPCDGVDAPKWHREEEPTIFTRDEQHFLKQAARGTPYEALLLLGLSVPMRVGELLGIARENVNLSRREIAIRQNLGETAEGGYVPTLGPLKTFESRRDVPMSDEVLSAFTRLLEARLAAGRTTPETLVFLSPEGHPVRYSHLFRRWFRPLLQAAAAEAEKAARAAGDRHYRFPVGASLYDLRHTAFTNMVEDGVAQGTFHALAGHANASNQLEALQQAVSQEPSRRRQRPSRAGRRSQLGPPPVPVPSPPITGGLFFLVRLLHGLLHTLAWWGTQANKKPYIT